MRRNPTRFTRGIGKLSAATLARVARTGDALAARQRELEEFADRVTYRGDAPLWIMAKITGNSVLSTNRWEYTWTEVELTTTGVQDRSGGLTSTDTVKAWNLCELVNDGSSIEGPGWNLATAPSGFAIKPIDQAVVQLWQGNDNDGEFRWFFQLANVLDGECPT